MSTDDHGGPRGHSAAAQAAAAAGAAATGAGRGANHRQRTSPSPVSGVSSSARSKGGRGVLLVGGGSEGSSSSTAAAASDSAAASHARTSEAPTSARTAASTPARAPLHHPGLPPHQQQPSTQRPQLLQLHHPHPQTQLNQQHQHQLQQQQQQRSQHHQQQQPPQPLPRLAAAAEALRLVDSKWAFDASGASKVLSDSGGGDFRVIGVLGAQGTGKSAFLNSLLYDNPAAERLAAAAAAAAASGSVSTASSSAGGGGGGGGSGVMPPFAVAADQQQQQQAGRQAGTGCGHTTSRLELRVHPGSRTLLLDTPPLWSAAWGEQLAASPEPPLLHSAASSSGGSGGSGGASLLSRAVADARSRGESFLSAEGVAELLGLQLGALLLAACHAVVVMVEAVDEPRLWEYLQVIDMVAHSLPDVAAAAAAAAVAAAAGHGGGGATPALIPSLYGSSTASTVRRVAEIVVVLCGVDGDALTVRHLRPQYELLRLALASSRLLHAGPEAHTINILRYLEGGGEGGEGAGAAAAACGADGGDCSSGGGGGGSGSSGGSLHFWALPRSNWQQLQQQPATTRFGLACDGCEAADSEAHLPPQHQHQLLLPLLHQPPPRQPPSLLHPLRCALLSMPRRFLAAAAAAAAAPSATPLHHHAHHPHPQHQSHPQHPHPQQHPQQLSERDWLRGVERLWGCELPRCPALERYWLARLRSAYAGGGGWPLAAAGR